MITGIDHVQLAIPRGGEESARQFYHRLLEMPETAKPAALAARGGCWFSAGSIGLHLGIADPFTPAVKAHPAFLLANLDATRKRLQAADYECVDANGEIPDVRRFHTFDPFGNRIEFQQA